MRNGLLALGICLLAAGAAAADQEIDSFRYASDADARTEWRAMFGSEEVSVLSTPLAGRRGLKLPCDLTGDKARSAWDRDVKLDLTKADRFTFRFYVDDPSKLAGYFSLYFASGEGWYAATFSAAKGWNAVSLDKSHFGPEGTPAGWNSIKTIRLSAWKSVSASTFVAIDDLRAVTSEVVVVLGDRTSQASPEWETVSRTARLVGKVLQEAGIDAGSVTDTDVENGALSGRKVAVFPYNPDITDKEMDAVEAFAREGGKIVAFFSVPSRMLQILGLRYKEFRREKEPGEFATIRFAAASPEDFPRQVRQASWNIVLVEPVGKNARAVGNWLNAKGGDTGLAAVTISDAGAFFCHILLSDDLPGKRRLMLSLVARGFPELWTKAARKALEGAVKVGEFEDLGPLTACVNASKRKEAQEHLGKGKRLLDEANKAVQAKKYPASMDLAEQARGQLAAAYCAAAPNKAGEMRAVWCHSAAGVAGMSWDEAVKALADGGFNMVLPNMLWGGRAYYKSALLPVDESVATDGDRIAQCVAAGKKYGVQVHVWKVNWNLMNAPKDFLAKMRSENRTQKTPAGDDVDWLCPSHPLNFALERDSMLEVARNYDVAGIHFDYIRYPGSQSCYCGGCRERFEKQFGVKVGNWPEDVVSGALRPKYLAFRRSNITRLVKAVSEEAHKIKPGIKVSAAVFSEWPRCAESEGQDWVTWVRDGYVDFVCPMDYTDSAARFDGLVSAQAANVKKAKPLLPGIGVTLGEWTLTADQVVRQILVARKRGADGFVLFNLDRFVVDAILPGLRAGATR